VAASAVKKFRKMILQYQGEPAGLRRYLLRHLDTMEVRADELLAGIIDEILL
jgi:hypothetical protein